MKMIFKLNRWDESYRSVYAWAELGGHHSVEIGISQSVDFDGNAKPPEINWPAIGSVSEVDALKFTQLMVAAVEAARILRGIAEWKRFKLPKKYAKTDGYPVITLTEKGPRLMRDAQIRL